MSEEMLKCRIVSSVICALYNKLTRLAILYRDDSQEYLETVKKLKALIPIEKEQYNELSNEELNIWYERLSNIKNKPQIDDRIHNQLGELVKIREGNLTHNGILLSTAITGKIMIDVFKDLYKNVIDVFFNEDVSKEEFETILRLFNIFKYNYLSVSNYCELICLEQDFDLDKIKSVSFRDIENQYQFNFVDNSRNLFFNYVVESIKEIRNMNYDNMYLTGFLSMFEVSRVNVMLKYLDKDSLILLSDFYNEEFNYKDNNALIKIKKMIDERKRDFR